MSTLERTRTLLARLHRLGCAAEVEEIIVNITGELADTIRKVTSADPSMEARAVSRALDDGVNLCFGLLGMASKSPTRSGRPS